MEREEKLQKSNAATLRNSRNHRCTRSQKAADNVPPALELPAYYPSIPFGLLCRVLRLADTACKSTQIMKALF